MRRASEGSGDVGGTSNIQYPMALALRAGRGTRGLGRIAGAMRRMPEGYWRPLPFDRLRAGSKLGVTMLGLFKLRGGRRRWWGRRLGAPGGRLRGTFGRARRRGRRRWVAGPELAREDGENC